MISTKKPKEHASLAFQAVAFLRVEVMSSCHTYAPLDMNNGTEFSFDELMWTKKVKGMSLL